MALVHGHALEIYLGNREEEEERMRASREKHAKEKENKKGSQFKSEGDALYKELQAKRKKFELLMKAQTVGSSLRLDWDSNIDMFRKHLRWQIEFCRYLKANKDLLSTLPSDYTEIGEGDSNEAVTLAQRLKVDVWHLNSYLQVSMGLALSEKLDVEREKKRREFEQRADKRESNRLWNRIDQDKIIEEDKDLEPNQFKSSIVELANTRDDLMGKLASMTLRRKEILEFIESQTASGFVLPGTQAAATSLDDDVKSMEAKLASASDGTKAFLQVFALLLRILKVVYEQGDVPVLRRQAAARNAMAKSSGFEESDSDSDDVDETNERNPEKATAGKGGGGRKAQKKWSGRRPPNFQRKDVTEFPRSRKTLISNTEMVLSEESLASSTDRLLRLIRERDDAIQEGYDKINQLQLEESRRVKRTERKMKMLKEELEESQQECLHATEYAEELEAKIRQYEVRNAALRQSASSARIAQSRFEQWYQPKIDEFERQVRESMKVLDTLNRAFKEVEQGYGVSCNRMEADILQKKDKIAELEKYIEGVQKTNDATTGKLVKLADRKDQIALQAIGARNEVVKDIEDVNKKMAELQDAYNQRMTERLSFSARIEDAYAQINEEKAVQAELRKQRDTMVIKLREMTELYSIVKKEIVHLRSNEVRDAYRKKIQELGDEVQHQKDLAEMEQSQIKREYEEWIQQLHHQKEMSDKFREAAFQQELTRLEKRAEETLKEKDGQMQVYQQRLVTYFELQHRRIPAVAYLNASNQAIEEEMTFAKAKAKATGSTVTSRPGSATSRTSTGDVVRRTLEASGVSESDAFAYLKTDSSSDSQKRMNDMVDKAMKATKDMNKMKRTIQHSNATPEDQQNHLDARPKLLKETMSLGSSGNLKKPRPTSASSGMSALDTIADISDDEFVAEAFNPKVPSRPQSAKSNSSGRGNRPSSASSLKVNESSPLAKRRPLSAKRVSVLEPTTPTTPKTPKPPGGRPTSASSKSEQGQTPRPGTPTTENSGDTDSSTTRKRNLNAERQIARVTARVTQLTNKLNATIAEKQSTERMLMEAMKQNELYEETTRKLRSELHYIGELKEEHDRMNNDVLIMESMLERGEARFQSMREENLKMHARMNGVMERADKVAKGKIEDTRRLNREILGRIKAQTNTRLAVTALRKLVPRKDIVTKAPKLFPESSERNLLLEVIKDKDAIKKKKLLPDEEEIVKADIERQETRKVIAQEQGRESGDEEDGGDGNGNAARLSESHAGDDSGGSGEDHDVPSEPRRRKVTRDAVTVEVVDSGVQTDTAEVEGT